MTNHVDKYRQCGNKFARILKADQFGTSSYPLISPCLFSTSLLHKSRDVKSTRTIGLLAELVEYLVKACKGSRHDIGHFFLLRRSIDRNTQFPSYPILLAASSIIILSRSRTERKPRGSTLGRAVCLVVRRMKIVSRGNATWFAGRRVSRVRSHDERATIVESTYALSIIFFFSFSRPLVEPIRRRSETRFRRPCGSRRANARARVHL